MKSRLSSLVAAFLLLFILFLGNVKTQNENISIIQEGFDTIQTSDFKCFGILSSNTTFVCSKHGNCVSEDNCECFPDYFGKNCEFTKKRMSILPFSSFIIAFDGIIHGFGLKKYYTFFFFFCFEWF